MKIINLALFGPGKVGSKLIQQIIAAKDQLQRNSDLEIRIVLIADSSNLITDNLGFNEHWKERFINNKDKVLKMFDERFFRMFEFYLSSCEMAFKHGDQVVYQLQLIKKLNAAPSTRDYIYS